MSAARVSFEHQLETLNENLIEMGHLVEDSIDRIVIALENQDRELAREIMVGDQLVNDLEKTIESQCLSLITRQQPVARDLRIVSAALKVVTDIERIGDHAADIGELIIRFEHADFYHISKKIPPMLAAAKKMVHNSVDAFINRDVKAASEVIVADDEVDELFNDIKSEIVLLLKEGDISPDYCVDMLMIAKYLERIGDHAVNIGEWTIFQKTGPDMGRFS
ncbi:MAG: phosphate transport system protein [Clostridiales bacterium]|nr:phosphate transport system protein [Clostridiales bacterium]